MGIRYLYIYEPFFNRFFNKDWGQDKDKVQLVVLEEEEEMEKKRLRIRFQILCLLTFYQPILGYMAKKDQDKDKVQIIVG